MEKLSSDAFSAIADGENDVMVSAVSAMEIATKSRKGLLAYRTSLADRFVAHRDLDLAHSIPARLDVRAETRDRFLSLRGEQFVLLLGRAPQIVQRLSTGGRRRVSR